MGIKLKEKEQEVKLSDLKVKELHKQLPFFKLKPVRPVESKRFSVDNVPGKYNYSNKPSLAAINNLHVKLPQPQKSMVLSPDNYIVKDKWKFTLIPDIALYALPVPDPKVKRVMNLHRTPKPIRP